MADVHHDSLQQMAELRRWCCWLIISAAVALQAAHILTVTRHYSPRDPWPKKPIYTPMLSANDRSRWCTVWSLAERGTFQIDEIIRQPGWNTIDKVLKDGHFYSSKPPFLTVCVAGVYWALKPVAGLDLVKYPHHTVQFLLLLINLLPFGISLVVLSRLLERCAASELTRIFVLITAACGTFLGTFLNTFNNHTVAANLILWSVPALVSIVADRQFRWYWFALAGLFSSLAVINEFPAAIYLAGVAGLLLRADWKKSLLVFGPSAALPIALHFGMTWVQTGSLKPFYAGFGTELYLYKGSYWANPQGIDRNLDHSWTYFLHCLIGHHGIFSLTPVFLLTVWGWLIRPSHVAGRLRGLHYLSLLCTVVVVAFYMTRTEQYNYGGVTSGLRWTFWLIPLWLLSMIPALDLWLVRNWFRGLALGMLAISVFSVTYPWNNPWTHPWLFQYLERTKWIDYSSPHLKSPRDAAAPAVTAPPRTVSQTWRSRPTTPALVELVGAVPGITPATAPSVALSVTKQ